MKSLLTIAFIAACHMLVAQDLRTLLVQQLKNTHSNHEWHVPINESVAGLTAEQASLKDGSGNHSVGQLVHHLVFWNERILAELKGQKQAEFTGSNDETFDKFDKKTWDDLVKRLDVVMVSFEEVVSKASDAQLKEMAATVANISAHNAYHTGQIIYARKQQKLWK